ncbi:MAG: tetratricopeptide repeat protein [Treponematales bacterium]
MKNNLCLILCCCTKTASFTSSKGNYEKASADYTQAIEFVEKSETPEVKKGDFNRNPLSIFYRKCAEAYAAKGKNDKALADFGEAAKCAPDDAVAYNSRGIIYKDIGKYGKAIAAFKQVIRLEPSNTTARSNLDVAKQGRKIDWVKLFMLVTGADSLYNSKPLPACAKRPSPPETGSEAARVPARECVPNGPAVIRFVVPQTIAAGRYRLSLATRWSGRKDKLTVETRTSVHKRVITVSAPAL